MNRSEWQPDTPSGPRYYCDVCQQWYYARYHFCLGYPTAVVAPPPPRQDRHGRRRR